MVCPQCNYEIRRLLKSYLLNRKPRCPHCKIKLKPKVQYRIIFIAVSIVISILVPIITSGYGIFELILFYLVLIAVNIYLDWKFTEWVPVPDSENDKETLSVVTQYTLKRQQASKQTDG